MQKHIIWGVGGLLIGFVTGGYLAYHSLSKVYKKKLKEAEELYLSGDEDEDLEDVDWDDPFGEDDEDAEETMEQCDNVFYENEEEINRLLKEYATRIEI